MSLSTFIPIPGIQGLVSFASKIIETSLTFVDELILAYCMRETLLYAVKAGHIAVLVKWFDGEPLPTFQRYYKHPIVAIRLLPNFLTHWL